MAGVKKQDRTEKGEPALKSLELGVLGYNLGFQKSPKSPFCASIIPKKVQN